MLLAEIAEYMSSNIKTEIIFISDSWDFNCAQNAIKYGVKYFITKPISIKELSEAIDKIRSDNYKRLEEKKQQQTLLQMNKDLLWEIDRQDFLHLCIGTIDPEEILNRRKRLRLLSTEDFENTYCAVVDVQIMNYVDVLCSNSIFKK